MEKKVTVSPATQVPEQEPVYENATHENPESGRNNDEPHPTQQLDRYISLKPIVAFGLTLQSSWEAVAVSFQASFFNGGPIALIYGIMIVGCGSCALAASLGEMASIDPAVGAQYRWAARYAPMNGLFWGLMQGWLTVLAWIAGCALTPFTLGTMVQGLIVFNYPDYKVEQWHGTLLMWAFVLLTVSLNFYARRLLVVLEVIGGTCHVLFLVCTIITLAILARHSTNEFVWNTSISGLTGWNNSGVTFCLGLLPAAFAVAGFDGVLHMADETKEASRRAPRSMVLTVVINAVFAFVYIVTLLYSVGNLGNIYKAPIGGLPILYVYYEATQSKAATNTLMAMIVIVGSVGCFSIFASVSRLTWAFARDGGLPFSRFFAYVHPTLRIPVNSLGLVAVCCCLLALVNLASTIAFYACISLSTLSLFISYIPPIFFFLLRKFGIGGIPPPLGPWNLGRFGIPINIFGLCYAVFMIVWLPFPSILPVDKTTMNYAAPIWIGCVTLAFVDFILNGRKRFKLPGEIGRANKVEVAA